MTVRNGLKALLVLLASAALPAAAAGFGAYVIPFSGDTSETVEGPSVIGSDGAYYAPFENSIGRITQDGSAADFHVFAGFDSFNTTTDVGLNSGGAYPSQMLRGSDGKLYGQTSAGGAYGFGTLFELAADGTLTTILDFDNRAQASQTTANRWNREIVQGQDGAFYGLVSLNSTPPRFFKVGSNGSYSEICTLPVAGYDPQTGSFSELIAGNDGNFYGLISTQTAYIYTTIFRLTPSCGYSEIYTAGQSIVSLMMATDGNLYALDQGNPSLFSAGTLMRLSTSGVATTLATFGPETYRFYQPGYWSCDAGHCSWIPGRWYTQSVTANATGYLPLSLIQTRDGTIYGTTFQQGLDGFGTLFRLAPDGSVSTVMSLPSAVNQPLMEDADGNLIGIDGYAALGNMRLLKIVPALPLATTASFSQSKVWLWQPTTLSWSSTGAQSCALISDLPGVSSASVATSGSITVKVTSTQLRSPAEFVAGVQCTAADGSLSNAAATLTIR